MGFIPVVISSYGGSVHNLAAMRDMIKAASKPVATIAIGKAMSAGIGLLACGTKGMRFAASDASMMIHEASSMAWGKSSDVTNEAKDLERATRQYLGNLAKDMGKKFKDLRKELDKHRNVDWYLSAKQAQKWGVVDHVGFPKIIKKSEFYNLEGMVTSAAKKRVRK
jgi:ATP-dependent Clp protease protease subunit